MNLDLFQVDSFTDTLFRGNPACVVRLTHWLDDPLLRQIAGENAVAETAFFIDHGDKILLRWFTPEIEMDLCGHATLATAFVLRQVLHYPADNFTFSTLSGDLSVQVNADDYTLNFPARKPEPSVLPVAIAEALSQLPLAVFKSRDYILVYSSEKEIREIQINRHLFDRVNLGHGGIIVTAPGEDCDFVSRFFTPQASILEDPVTGSAHCSLVPYWGERLHKTEMLAMQLSKRTGRLVCAQAGDRVFITGKARLYSTGTIWLEGGL